MNTDIMRRTHFRASLVHALKASYVAFQEVRIPADPVFSTLSEEFTSNRETMEARKPGECTVCLHHRILPPPRSAKDQAFQLAATPPWSSKINKIIFVNTFSF